MNCLHVLPGDCSGGRTTHISIRKENDRSGQTFTSQCHECIKYLVTKTAVLHNFSPSGHSWYCNLDYYKQYPKPQITGILLPVTIIYILVNQSAALVLRCVCSAAL